MNQFDIGTDKVHTLSCLSPWSIFEDSFDVRIKVIRNNSMVISTRYLFRSHSDIFYTSWRYSMTLLLTERMGFEYWKESQLLSKREKKLIFNDIEKFSTKEKNSWQPCSIKKIYKSTLIYEFLFLLRPTSEYTLILVVTSTSI